MSQASPIGERDRSSAGRGHVALVTGASSGIGQAMAELLAAKGYDVVPVPRRADRLQALKEKLEPRWGVKVHLLAADLADPESPRRIAKELDDRGLVVDFLVNNAGFSPVGAYADRPWVEYERQIRVLALATLELTHLLLPAMVERGWGRIINVASIAGLSTATPNMVLYSASKAMVHKFSEGIAEEYASHGVHCTASLPGFTATEIFEATGVADEVASNPLARMAMMRPETVARQAYGAVMTDRRSIVHGWHNKLLATIVLHSPQPVRRWMSNRQGSGVRPD